MCTNFTINTTRKYDICFMQWSKEAPGPIAQIIIYSKYSRRFWLAPFPRLILRTQLALTTYASDIPSIWWYIWLETRLIEGMFTWKRGCLGNSEFLTKTERKKCKNTRNILLDGCYLFLSSISKEPWREIAKSFEESLRGDKLVKNFEIFWMNNKTIIEFGFRLMWRMLGEY